MASLDAFLKDQGYQFSQTDKEVKLEKSRKLNVISIVVGLIGIAVFVLIGVVFETAGSLMFIIAGLILLIVMRFNFRGFRPITIFDWTFKTMVKKSTFFFVNSITTKIEGYNGIDLRTVDLASSSSEGVDEFQKTIYLKTSNGEVDVIDFYTDFEAMEPEIPVIMQAIHDHLMKAKQAG